MTGKKEWPWDTFPEDSSTWEECVTKHQELKEENEKLKRENELLHKIADFAGWTHYGSRLYKDPIFCTVSQEFYMGLYQTFHEWDSEFGKVAEMRKGVLEKYKNESKST